MKVKAVMRILGNVVSVTLGVVVFLLLVFLLAYAPRASTQTRTTRGTAIDSSIPSTVFTGSILHSGIGYPAAPSIVSGFSAGTSAYYWCVAEDANGRQTTSSTLGTGTTSTTGTMSCGPQTGAVKYYLLRTSTNVNPGGPPANTLIGSCTTVSGSPCNIADAATSPTSFQANTSDLTAVIDDGSFPPPRESLGRTYMVGGLSHKQINVGAGATHTAASLTGKGAITQIWAAIQWTGCEITITRDGEGTPSIDAVPCSEFFGTHGQTGSTGLAAPFMGEYIGGAPASRIQIFMPFETSMVVELENTGAGAGNLWVQTSVVYTKRNWGLYSHLHVPRTSTTIAAYAEDGVLDVDGPGALWGQIWKVVGGDGNLQYQEGPIRHYYDNSATAGYESTGFEDYFNFTGYFNQCTTTISHVFPEFGCNNVFAPNSFTHAYRFFMKEPVVFNSHLTVTATNGVNGIGFPVTNNTTYDVVSFYYTEY